MHDFLDYMSLDPYFRKNNHHKMTFAMSYNNSEKYILVLSHDEVVHLKKSMWEKMPGDEEDKFRNLKSAYSFMMGHPGRNGFEWINADDADRSIYSFVRKSKNGKNSLLFVCNMTPVARDDYRVGVPKKGTYHLLLNSNEARFGGTEADKSRPASYKAVKSECDGREYSISYPLPPFGVAVFRVM